MKNQLNQLRRFFARTSAKKFNASATRESIPGSYADDDKDTRLSGAFVVVLILHIVALAGVFAFSKIRDKNQITTPAAAQKKSPPSSLAAVMPGPVEQRQPTPRVEDSSSTLPPEPELPPLPAAGTRTYIVKPGDTLTRISLAYGIKPADIAAANSLKNKDELKVGQEIIVPEVQSAPPTPGAAGTVRKVVKDTPPATTTASKKVIPSTYTIRKNDTLAKVAREFGVSYDELAKLNNIKDPRKIQAGDVLKLPKKN